MQPMPPAPDDNPYNAPPINEPRAAQVDKPQSIRQAVILMWAGAIVSLLGGILSLTAVDIDQLIADTTADTGNALSADATRNIIYFSVFFGLAIGTGLWVWMAIMNDKGKKWARVVATVFFAISVISSLAALTGATPTATISKVISIVSLLIGLGAIILLYRPESSRYYEAMSARRY